MQSLLLILFFFLFVYFTDPFNIFCSFESNAEIRVNETVKSIINQLDVFENKEFIKKNKFNVEDVVFVTAFTEDHLLEAL